MSEPVWGSDRPQPNIGIGNVFTIQHALMSFNLAMKHSDPYKAYLEAMIIYETNHGFMFQKDKLKFEEQERLILEEIYEEYKTNFSRWMRNVANLRSKYPTAGYPPPPSKIFELLRRWRLVSAENLSKSGLLSPELKEMSSFG